MQIDQDERRHSHLYELKPMSRWWLVFAGAFCLVLAYANGLDRPLTWILICSGCIFAAFAILVFPRYWLSKIND